MNNSYTLITKTRIDNQWELFVTGDTRLRENSSMSNYVRHIQRKKKRGSRGKGRRR